MYKRKLKIHTQYLVAITSVAKPIGWAEGDSINLTVENGIIVIENLTDSSILAERSAEVDERQRIKAELKRLNDEDRERRVAGRPPSREASRRRSERRRVRLEKRRIKLEEQQWALKKRLEEDASLRNLVWFYREELDGIRNGTLKTTECIRIGPRRHLARAQVLIKQEGRARVKYHLNEAVEPLLDEFLAEGN